MLTPIQIEKIEDQVVSFGISFSHLPDDLIDHICCDVESRMDNGETFDQAFKKIKKEIGIEGLKKIEKQTLLIIHQNYLIMKKALIVLSIVSVSLVVLSGILKILHLPGASILLTLSFLALVFGFIPLLFLTRNKEDRERKQVWVNLSGYLASTVFLLSILWGIMHWPGRTWLVLLSWILILGFFLPAYLTSVVRQKNLENRLTNIGVILLIVFLVVIEIVFTFNSKQSAYTHQDTVVNNLSEMTEFYQHQNAIHYEAILQDSTFPEEKMRKVQMLKEQSEAFETELVALAFDIDRLNRFNSPRLKGKKPEDFEARVEKLRQMTDNYKETIIGEFTPSQDMIKLIEKTCDTKGDEGMSIYELYFTKPAVMIRNNLLRLNRDVLLIENELLEELLL